MIEVVLQISPGTADPQGVIEQAGDAFKQVVARYLKTVDGTEAPLMVRAQWSSVTDAEAEPAGDAQQQMTEMTDATAVSRADAEHFSRLEQVSAGLRLSHDNIDLRLALWVECESALAAMESSARKQGKRNRARLAGLLRDILNFNYAEEAAHDQVEAICDGVDGLRMPEQSLGRDRLRGVYRRICRTGLRAMPVTRKAEEMAGNVSEEQNG